MHSIKIHHIRLLIDIDLLLFGLLDKDFLNRIFDRFFDRFFDRLVKEINTINIFVWRFYFFIFDWFFFQIKIIEHTLYFVKLIISLDDIGLIFRRRYWICFCYNWFSKKIDKIIFWFCSSLCFHLWLNSKINDWLLFLFLINFYFLCFLLI